MKASLLAVLTDAERLLVDETSRQSLAGMDEDAVAALHDRVRRARNKYVGQYRRSASARVVEHGGRGMARPRNERAAQKAEAFEKALARVSRRLSVLAAESAAALRDERLAVARAAKAAQERPAATPAPARTRRGGGRSGGEPKGDRALRSPRTEKARAGTKASGARRQAKRDARPR